MVGVLPNLSDDLAETVDMAGSMVVRVEGRKRLPASGIVWSRDGVIVTANHIVEQDDNISVGLSDGQTMTVALVGRDPTTDIAVLRAQFNGLTVPTWAESENLRVGHLVLALGRPGQSVRATLGIVSALGNKSWHTPAGGRIDQYLQTDVVMYPGFSGGPLVDAAGQFVGLNSSALLRGISMTVPANTLRRVVENLLAHGRIRRGYLGIGTQPVRLPTALAQQLGQETGLMLVSVEPDSPAGTHGLLLGDTLVSLEGQQLRSVDELLVLLSEERIGREVSVRIVRSGKILETTITVGEQT